MAIRSDRWPRTSHRWVWVGVGVGGGVVYNLSLDTLSLDGSVELVNQGQIS